MTKVAKVNDKEPKAGDGDKPQAKPVETKREIKPILASRVGLQEHKQQVHVAEVDPATPKEDLSNPKFWTNVIKDCGFRIMDEIKIIYQDRSYYAHALIIGIHDGGVHLEFIKRVDLSARAKKTAPNGSLGGKKVQYLGPIKNWCVTNDKGDKILAENLGDELSARKEAKKLS